MNKSSYKMNAIILMLSFLILFLSGCSSLIKPISAPTQEAATLKIAILPILDSFPIRVAQKEGLFEKNGVKVELIPVQSAPERDQVVSAGQADGMINEVLSTMFYNKDKPRVEIVRFARAASADASLFSIVASAKSGISDANGLKGKEIGISEGTVIEYLTDRLLEKEGLKPEEIKTVAIPKIPDRLALIINGDVAAGMLPEPLPAQAVAQGAKVVVSDTSHPDLSYSTIAFRNEVIEQHPEAVRAFLAALEQAVQKINANPDSYKQLLADEQLIPPPLLASYKIPQMTTAGVPSQDQWNDVLDWAKGKGLLDKDVSYDFSVNPSFLP